MPFCRECGKEVKNDWATCPFCSASLQIDTPPQSNNYKIPQGSPSSDWKSVSHNGQLIELVPSENWEYYWADDEWHSVNQPIQSSIQTDSASKVPPSISKAMSSNTMAPTSSFHSTRGASTRSPSGRNTTHEMFEDDDEEDDKKPRSIIAEVLKLILFDIPMGYFATELMKNGEPMMGIFLLLGIPLIHIGPNASKKVKVASVIFLTIIITVALAGILSVWATHLVEDSVVDNPYTWNDNDANGNVNNGTGDALIEVSMASGSAINWAVVKVSISVDGGTLQACSERGSCSFSAFQSGNEQAWEPGEGITIMENGQDLCDFADGGCVIEVTITKKGIGSEEDMVIGTITRFCK